MKRTRQRWLFILAAGAALLVAACSSEEAPTQPVATTQQDQPAAVSQQQSQTAAAPTAPVPLEITGKVEQTASGIVISTNVFDYHVAGQDLTAMVGKFVKATGTVEESEGKFTINVESITEMGARP